MKKKLYAMVRTSVTNTTHADLGHERRVDQESQLKMAHAKKKWLIDYQVEREKKREYVLQHVAANGLDVGKLQQKIQASKNAIIPSLDDIDMTELTNLVDELRHEDELLAQENLDQIDSNKTGGSGGDNSDTTSSIALFDKLQEKEDKELDDSVSSVRSSNSFRSMSTRKSKLTVLNQKAYSQIYVTDVYQLIT